MFHTPVRLIPITSFQMAGVTASQGWMVQMPALATTTSRCPNCATPSVTTLDRPSRSRTSSLVATMEAPVSSTNLTVSARSSSVASG